MESQDIKERKVTYRVGKLHRIYEYRIRDECASWKMQDETVDE